MPQRPLTGEPLALDLVNTWWVQDGHDVDLFDDDAALAGWLAEHDLVRSSDPPPDGSSPYRSARYWSARYRSALREVRAALRGVLEETPGAVDDLDTALAHGRLRLVLADGRGGAIVELDDPTWGPAWAVARAYLDLLGTAPSGRIRHCAGTGCVLWFLDTSRNGGRRWCSMAGCGNRAKAHAHYHRGRSAPGSAT